MAMTPLPDLIAKARGAQNLQRIPDGFGSRSPRTAHFQGGRLDPEHPRWMVCRAPMMSSCFRLLDATVRQVLERGAEGAVAILGRRPKKDGRGPEPGDGYLKRFQQVAWSAFRVAWVLEGDDRFLADRSIDVLPRDGFDDVVVAVEAALGQEPLAEIPKNSREAEKRVLKRIEPILKRVGFARVVSRYKGFWRTPSADGIWERAEGRPRSFGLEVKLHEDLVSPLCQAAELLGRVDGMVYVRVGSLGLAPGSTTDLAEKAMRMFERGAPVRYLGLAVRT